MLNMVKVVSILNVLCLLFENFAVLLCPKEALPSRFSIPTIMSPIVATPGKYHRAFL